MPYRNIKSYEKTTKFSDKMLKFGRNPDVDTGAYEDIWDGGSTWVGPTQSRIHAIASTNANDADAGTGAQTVHIYGLGSDYLNQDEVVTLSGSTAVNTAKSYTMIHRMVVETAGSGGTNAGTITATAAVDGTVTAQISLGAGQTLMAIYQVPGNNKGFLERYYASMNNVVTAISGDVSIQVKPFGSGSWQTKHTLGLMAQGTSLFDYHFPIALELNPKDTVRLRAQVSANNVDMTGGFDIYLTDTRQWP